MVTPREVQEGMAAFSGHSYGGERGSAAGTMTTARRKEALQVIKAYEPGSAVERHQRLSSDQLAEMVKTILRSRRIR